MAIELTREEETSVVMALLRLRRDHLDAANYHRSDMDADTHLADNEQAGASRCEDVIRKLVPAQAARMFAAHDECVRDQRAKTRR